MPITTLAFVAWIHFYAPEFSSWLVPAAIATVLAVFAVLVEVAVSKERG